LLKINKYKLKNKWKKEHTIVQIKTYP